jgi:1-aminocyclopropane-1-carboxylate deaminase/D-cysteine desulfhydrase-like pyridoxal-dependent ACC family enzyme
LGGTLGTKLRVKRDDLTGLALGGNKSRQLEFILGRALDEGADVLITMAAVQSNQCRQTAAAARKIGLPVHVVLRGAIPEVPDGNFLLDRLFGAVIHHVPAEASQAEFNAAVNALAAQLRAGGRTPYIVDLFNDDSCDQELGAVAYALMVAELIEQLGGVGSAPAWIYLSSGTAASATFAGTWLGCRALGLDTRVVGVAAGIVGESADHNTLGIARRAADALGIETGNTDLAQPTIIERGFVGEGYGVATDSGLEAMALAAETEGLVLDPVYTGKALAALVAHARQGRIETGADVVFVHTGGTPLTFLHEFAQKIAGQPR